MRSLRTGSFFCLSPTNVEKPRGADALDGDIRRSAAKQLLAGVGIPENVCVVCIRKGKTDTDGIPSAELLPEGEQHARLVLGIKEGIGRVIGVIAFPVPGGEDVELLEKVA